AGPYAWISVKIDGNAAVPLELLDASAVVSGAEVMGQCRNVAAIGGQFRGYFVERRSARLAYSRPEEAPATPNWNNNPHRTVHTSNLVANANNSMDAHHDARTPQTAAT